MNNTDFYLQVIHTLVHTLTYTQHSQKYNGSNTHATDICTRTHIHTHRQQIIIIYTSMATDIIQELLPLKMNWLKGKMKRQIKLLRVIDFAILSYPPRKYCHFKGKEAHYLLSTLLCTDFLPCTRIIYVHLISDYTINSLGLNPFLYYFYNFWIPNIIFWCRYLSSAN